MVNQNKYIFDQNKENLPNTRISIVHKTYNFCSYHAYFKIYILGVKKAACQNFRIVGRQFLSAPAYFDFVNHVFLPSLDERRDQLQCHYRSELLHIRSFYQVLSYKKYAYL